MITVYMNPQSLIRNVAAFLKRMRKDGYQLLHSDWCPDAGLTMHFERLQE